MSVKTYVSSTTLSASDMNTYSTNSGLVYVTSTTVGTAVSTVTINNCFTSTFDNYRIVYTGGVANTGTALSIQLNPTSVTGYNTSYYSALNYLTYVGGAGAARDNNAVIWTYVGAGSTVAAALSADILGPNLAKYTYFQAIYTDPDLNGVTGGIHKVASAFSGFVLSAGANNITGGTITVYGYRKA